MSAEHDSHGGGGGGEGNLVVEGVVEPTGEVLAFCFEFIPDLFCALINAAL